MQVTTYLFKTAPSNPAAVVVTWLDLGLGMGLGLGIGWGLGIGLGGGTGLGVRRSGWG